MTIGEIVRQNRILRPILRYIKKKLYLIIEIRPYYLHQEFLLDEGTVTLEPKLGHCTLGFLTPAEIKAMSASSEVSESEDILLEWLANGCRCIGIKHDGEIAAYMWYNLRKCDHEFLSFPLKEDEAYLFDARTFKAYKGKNLAPYLRHQLYKHLGQMGRTKFYSITKAFNTSALNFKKKLKAKPLKLYLYVKLFQRFSWNIPLKSYKR